MGKNEDTERTHALDKLEIAANSKGGKTGNLDGRVFGEGE